jgi:hypothetical protein
MLTKSEKYAKCISFIESDKFGLETYNTLFLFNINVSYLIQTVRLYDTLIQNLGKSDYPTEHGELQLLRLKQYVKLDAISRIEAAIESTLVLIDELSKGYSNVAHSMTYYGIKRPRDIVKKIASNKNGYCMRKVLGLPDIGSLGLDLLERRLLGKIYLETTEIMGSYIKKLALFYDRYRIIYGKHKHGLTLEAGSGFDYSPIVPLFEDSMLFAFDHKTKDDMPIGTLTVKETHFPIGKWFNVQSALKFNKALDDEISEILAILKEVVGYVTFNHIDYALNCGEGYLPTNRIGEDKVNFTFFLKAPLSNEDNAIAQAIMDKLLPMMNLKRGNVYISRSVTDHAILKSLVNDPITNMWFSNR